MKKFLLLTMAIIAMVVFMNSSSFGQAPQGINYQAVLRDGAGVIMANEAVTVQFTIHSGSAGGATVYQETHSLTTNDYGLVTTDIGGGTPVTGNFSNISWGTDDFFLQVEVNDGGGYVDLGTTQLMSVPYALYSENANNAVNAQNATDMQLNDLTDVNATPAVNEVLKWNGSQWVADTDNTGGGGGSPWTANGNDIYNNNIGNVGVGTTNPQTQLEVGGVIRSTTNLAGGILEGYDPHHALYLRVGKDSLMDHTDLCEYGNIRFFTGGLIQDQLERMIITNYGYIGIGTSSPGYLLDVNGYVRVGNQLQVGDGNLGASSVYINDIADASWLLNTAGYQLNIMNDNGGSFNNKMTITSSGYVGIGTSAPTVMLDVDGQASLGGPNSVTGGSSVALGRDNTVSGYGSFVAGRFSSATQNHSIALGYQCNATAGQAVSMGWANTSSGLASFTAGKSNVASGNYAAALGNGNNATGISSFALGNLANSNHDGAFVWADHTNAAFTSTAADQFLIRAVGGVGIGTNAPENNIHIKQSAQVSGNGGIQFEEDNSSDNWKIGNGSVDDFDMYYNSALNGYFSNGSGTYVAVSDASLKTDIEPLSSMLTVIEGLRPVKYHFKTNMDEQKSYGFIAQDVEKVLPDLVHEKDGLKMLAYTDFGVISVQAVKELNELVKEQQQQINQLIKSNADMQNQIEALKNN